VAIDILDFQTAWEPLVGEAENYARLPVPSQQYDVEWLRKGVEKFARILEEKKGEKEKQRKREDVQDFGGREGSRLQSRLFDLSPGVPKVLAGPLNEEVERFIRACDPLTTIAIPATTPVRRGDRMVREGCGRVHTSHNLSPEWLRHFMGALYDKEEFRKALDGREYYPFENQDHLVHSIFVFLFGHVVLGQEVDELATTCVYDSLPKGLVDKSVVTDCKTVCDLVQVILAARGLIPPNTFADYDVTWTRLAWSLIALWHDAGYDASTWYLLTTREFAHLNCLEPMPGKSQQQIKGIIDRIVNLLEDFLPTDFSGLRLSSPNCDRVDEPYHLMWCVDRCGPEDERRWGRWHAILSAHEFLERLGWDMKKQDQWLGILGGAIAEHHEQQKRNIAHDDNTNGHKVFPDDKRLAADFVRNPLGVVLQFVDDLSGVMRVKVEWPDNSNNGVSFRPTGSEVTFSLKLSDDSVFLEPKADNNKRTAFYHASDRNGNGSREARKVSLWGTIQKAKKDAGTVSPENSNVLDRIIRRVRGRAAEVAFLVGRILRCDQPQRKKMPPHSSPKEPPNPCDKCYLGRDHDCKR
jgi:hypothetical protein